MGIRNIRARIIFQLSALEALERALSLEKALTFDFENKNIRESINFQLCASKPSIEGTYLSVLSLSKIRVRIIFQL